MQRFFGGGDVREEGGKGGGSGEDGRYGSEDGRHGGKTGGEGEMGALGIATRHATSLQTPGTPPRVLADGQATFGLPLQQRPYQVHKIDVHQRTLHRLHKRCGMLRRYVLREMGLLD